MLYVHLTKPNISFSSQPISLAVETQMRTEEGGVAITYMSPNTQGMRILIGNSGNELYLQTDAKHSSSLQNELLWLSQTGALQNLDENDISGISTLATSTSEITYSTSSGGWEAVSLPFVATQTAQEGTQATTEAASEQTEGAPSQEAQSNLECAKEGASGSDECVLAVQPSPSDFIPQFAPLCTVAAVLLAIIAALFMRPQANEQIETHRILSSPTRMEILNELSTNEKIPTDLSSRLKKSKATIIEHLERMQEAGFVEKVQTPGKKFVYYRITSKGKTALLRSAA